MEIGEENKGKKPGRGPVCPAPQLTMFSSPISSLISDVGAVPGPQDETPVHGELHVACARRLVAGSAGQRTGARKGQRQIRGTESQSDGSLLD